jgi:hypothetical protein
MSEQFYIEPAQMKIISDKISGMTRWLAENAPYCETLQKHLDGGTVEQAYWHYGYLCALKDVVSAINLGSSE